MEMKRIYFTTLILVICVCNTFAQYYVPRREPIRKNLDAFMYAIDKIDAQHKEALSYRTAICNAYVDIVSRYNLSEEAENRITEIKDASIKRIDNMALYGSYSYSLDTAIKEYGTVIPQMRKIAEEDVRSGTNVKGNEFTQTASISDIEYAHSFYKENKFDKAVEYYSKVDLSRLNDDYLIEYATAELLQGNSQRSLDISLEGLKRNPRNAVMNRIAFYNSTDLGDFKNALKYADILFNQLDGVEFTARDYHYYGYAFMGDNSYDKAIEMFKKALEKNAELNDIRIQLSKAYAAKGEFIKSLAYYEEYLNRVNQPTIPDLDGLAQLYFQYALSIDVLNKEKKDALNTADEIYKRIAESQSNKLYAIMWRARINSQLDPEATQGLAKPYYEEYIKIVQMDYVDNPKLLIEPYLYLGHYYIVNKNTAMAKIFYEKVIAIDSHNPTATIALEML